MTINRRTSSINLQYCFVSPLSSLPFNLSPSIRFAFNNMSFQNEPVDPNYGGDRLQLFNVEEPITFSLQEFEVKWREVDNIWSQVGTTKPLKKGIGWTKTYDCRFKKRRVNPKKDVKTPVEKQRKTSSRDPDLCKAQISITLKDNVVTVRKTHTDGPNHTHDMRASDIIKKPSEVTEFIAAETSKGYRAPAVKEAAAGQAIWR